MFSTSEAAENNEYLAQLNARQIKALGIARSMLGTSFDLRKSNGFLEWKSQQSKLTTAPKPK
jgi:hypothetical protein